MARLYFDNGECMVTVKNAQIPFTQLGLAQDPIDLSFDVQHFDIKVDTWGPLVAPERQMMLGGATLTMNLVHFDQAVLDQCVQQAFCVTTAAGTMPRAGTLMGNNAALQTAGNYYLQVMLSSPVAGKPWCFFACYLTGNPLQFPIGTERTVARTTFKVIPYPPNGDPWNNGQGALGVVLWNNSTVS